MWRRAAAATVLLRVVFRLGGDETRNYTAVECSLPLPIAADESYVRCEERRRRWLSTATSIRGVAAAAAVRSFRLAMRWMLRVASPVTCPHGADRRFVDDCLGELVFWRLLMLYNRRKCITHEIELMGS
jgi:hypothetical protein